jgi:hypothetical protein
MTIYDTHHPLFFATLIRNYLAGADSVAAGVPDEETLPKHIMEAGTQPTLPSMVMVGVENGSKGARRVVMLSCQILTGIKPVAEGAAELEWQTSLATLSQWLVSMENRMRSMNDAVDGDVTIKGWRSWLAEQDESLRQGWRSMKFVFHGLGTPKRKDTTTIIHSFSFDLHYVLV